MDQLPRRLSESRVTASKLAGEIESHTILSIRSVPDAADVLKDAISINVWIGRDGRQRVEVESARDIHPLEVKGILHDALYALAHLEASPVTT
jgi:hypothetical protein